METNPNQFIKTLSRHSKDPKIQSFTLTQIFIINTLIFIFFYYQMREFSRNDLEPLMFFFLFLSLIILFPLVLKYKLLETFPIRFKFNDRSEIKNYLISSLIGMVLGFGMLTLLIIERRYTLSQVLTTTPNILLLASVVIIAITEEITFRGIIQSETERVLQQRVTLIVLIPNFWFMLYKIVIYYHFFQGYTFLFSVIIPTIGGIILSLVQFKTKNLINPILLHFWYNLILFWPLQAVPYWSF